MEMTAMNGVLVKMKVGDTESFRTATSWRVAGDFGNGSALHVLQDDTELACFPAGEWTAVRFCEGHTPKPTEPADLCANPDYSCGNGPGHTHVHKDWANRRAS